MVRRFPAALLLAGLLSASLFAQTPQRDTVRPRAGTARVSGRVVAADTGVPVRRALVRLSPTDSRDSRTTMTDVNGNYEFTDVSDGGYRLSASKDAYLSAFFGTDRRYPQGRTFRVEAGEKLTNLNVAIARSCAISGRVYDDFGEGIPYADVNVLRFDPPGSRRMVNARREGRTDDLGQYRVFGLEPGDYYIQVFPKRIEDITDEPMPGTLAPTFYPGTPDPSQAQPVRVARGQDAIGIDLMIGAARTARVSGTVIDPAGRHVAAGVYAEYQVTLAGASTPASTQARADGTFVLGPLPPASYVIGAAARKASAQDGDDIDMGVVKISVAGADVDGITIQMNPGSTLSGHVLFDGPARLSSFDRISIEAAPVDAADPGAPPIRLRQVRPDGSFLLPGLFSQQIITVSPPPGWMVKAIYAGGRDVVDTPITFDRGESITGAQVVLTNRITRLTVSATDETGKALDDFYVLVASDDPARWASFLRGRYLRGAVSRDGAAVNIDGLLPGSYFAVPFDAEQSLADLTSPDVLSQLRTAGQRFTLKEGETRTMMLKVSK